MAAPPAWKVLPGDLAAAEAFRPLTWGEAPRIGIVGDSGTGKTEAARRLVARYLHLSLGVALVIDDKELRSRFEGQEFRGVGELAVHAPAPEPRVYVFRGKLLEGEKVDAGQVAKMAWRMAARRRPALIVYDELARAAQGTDDGAKWRKGCERVADAFGEGRALGIASLWGTQGPHNVPREAFEQSNSLLVFRLDGMGLNLLKRRNYVNDDATEAAIRALPGDELEPAKRGYFVLLRRGRPWDGKVYRFS